MENNNFLVSVIIPVYNGERFLAEALNSIEQQSYPVFEIILVDDGSTDNTAKIAQSYSANNFHYIYQTNKGPAAARNTGIKLARGNIIGFLDVDDIWIKNKLEIQLKYFANDPLLNIVRGHIQLRLADDARTDIPHETEKFPGPFFHFGSALFRKSVFSKVGLLDETLQHGEDHFWFTNAAKHNVSVKTHDDIIYLLTKHKNNMTNFLFSDSTATRIKNMWSLYFRKDQSLSFKAKVIKLSWILKTSYGLRYEWQVPFYVMYRIMRQYWRIIKTNILAANSAK